MDRVLKDQRDSAQIDHARNFTEGKDLIPEFNIDQARAWGIPARCIVSVMENLTIEYALARGEMVRAFLQGLGSSVKFRIIILRTAAAFGLFIVLLRATLMRSVTLQDVLIGVAWSFGFLILLPVLLFIRGKTARRVLTVSPDGISTEIGSLKGSAPWRKIKVISDTGQFILVANMLGNAFFIPNRAFSGPEQRAWFFSETSHAVMNALKQSAAAKAQREGQ
jgi:hypothetical protein